MAAQLTIPYETLVSLVAQLSPGEQENLLQWLQERRRQQVALSDDAWVAAFRSLVIETPLVGSIPLRRAEWYDDDGR